MSLTSRVLASFGAEDREQRRVILHCEARGIPVFHVPNSTYTKSVMQHERNRLLGVRSGVPDLFALPGGHMVAIEMKSATGVATKAQKEWIERFKAAGIPAIISKTAEPAIEFLDHYADNPKPTSEAIIMATEMLKSAPVPRKDRRIMPTDDRSPF